MVLLYVKFSLLILIVRVTITSTTALSYNRPKLCPNATWNQSAVTFAESDIVGTFPYALFVNSNDSVYVINNDVGKVYVWESNGVNFTIVWRSIGVNFSMSTLGLQNNSWSLFVTVNKEIYLYNRLLTAVQKSRINAPNSSITIIFLGTTVMNASGRCVGLFIDMNDTLYCSIDHQHVVVAASLNGSSGNSVTVAGNGLNGSAANMLSYPKGIFVDADFALYVADCFNDRIQKFLPGNADGMTVTNSDETRAIVLRRPTGVVLDADGNLFIVDSDNNRIVRSGLLGFQCLVGCSGNAGSAAGQLNNPFTLNFDSYGNMFISDSGNGRIQKFFLVQNQCDSTQTTTIADELPPIDFPIDTTQLANSTTILSRRTIPTIAPPSTTSLVNTTELSTTTASMPVTTRTVIPAATTTTASINLRTVSSLVPFFLAMPCPDTKTTGPSCNISIHPCDYLTPCHNGGACLKVNTTTGYSCACPNGFSGPHCEDDIRLCTPTTCWHNGSCANVSKTGSLCSCTVGWEGVYCQTMINHCRNITCSNGAVCRPLFLDYKCECLTPAFSGRHCEEISSDIIIRQVFSKTCGYVGAAALVTVVMIVILCDILKYVFHIDPAGRQMKQKKLKKRKQQPPRLALRFVYVDHPVPNNGET